MPLSGPSSSRYGQEIIEGYVERFWLPVTSSHSQLSSELPASTCRFRRIDTVNQPKTLRIEKARQLLVLSRSDFPKLNAFDELHRQLRPLRQRSKRGR